MIVETLHLAGKIGAVFRSFKNDLGLGPIYHSVQPRVEAHIFVCFLAYCLHVTLRQRLNALAPGLTARAVVETLAGVEMLDLEVPTSDGRWLSSKSTDLQGELSRVSKVGLGPSSSPPMASDK